MSRLAGYQESCKLLSYDLECAKGDKASIRFQIRYRTSKYVNIELIVRAQADILELRKQHRAKDATVKRKAPGTVKSSSANRREQSIKPKKENPILNKSNSSQSSDGETHTRYWRSPLPRKLSRPIEVEATKLRAPVDPSSASSSA